MDLTILLTQRTVSRNTFTNFCLKFRRLYHEKKFDLLRSEFQIITHWYKKIKSLNKLVWSSVGKTAAWSQLTLAEDMNVCDTYEQEFIEVEILYRSI